MSRCLTADFLLQDVVSTNASSTLSPAQKSAGDSVEQGMLQKRTIEFRRFHDTQPLKDVMKQLKDESNLFGTKEEADEGLEDLGSQPHSPKAVPDVNSAEALRSGDTALQAGQCIQTGHPSSSTGSSIRASVREAAAALIPAKGSPPRLLYAAVDSMWGCGHRVGVFPEDSPMGSIPLPTPAHPSRPIGRLGDSGPIMLGDTGEICIDTRTTSQLHFQAVVFHASSCLVLNAEVL